MNLRTLWNTKNTFKIRAYLSILSTATSGWDLANKFFQVDQNTLSCLLLAQKPRQNALAAEHGR